MAKKRLIWLGSGAILLIGLIVGGVGFFFHSEKKSPPSPEPERRPAEVVNQLPIEERPWVRLLPEADGRNLTLVVESQVGSAQTAKYELEYQAGSLLQGAFGELALATLPVSKTILLGSCSAGGACTYHTEVKGGSLLMRLVGETTEAIRAEWRYFDNLAKENTVASKDAKFQLQAEALKAVRYSLVFNGFGVPAGLEGRIVSDPFVLQTSSALTGQGTVSIRAHEEGALKLAIWDGLTWSYLEGSVDSKTITAEVPLAPLYVVVSSP